MMTVGGNVLLTKRGNCIYHGSIATADNWAFTPVYVTSVGDAVNVLSKEGYLSPSGKNSFTFVAASTKNPDVTQRTPYSVETC
ncbi:MAG TPA: hypothetical protein VFQ30_03405 [Ktedonobacteraceae bacterium]|nr:hypothetical protein [Ktedonobacteraceae bacterium]